MHRELNKIMWDAWKKIEHKVLNDETELRRRLARREKIFDRVPRPLCFAIRANDRRINHESATISPHFYKIPGEQCEHDVVLTSSLIRQLSWPVELCYRLRFSRLAKELGCAPHLPRVLERRGILPGERIPGLGGNWHTPYPLVGPGFPQFLDPNSKTKTAPDDYLLAFWRELGTRLPHDIRQTLRRKPVIYTIRGRERFMSWTWLCPSCKRTAKTLYFPMGAPDWARAHNIRLPDVAWYDPPYQPGTFACGRCHHVFCISRVEKYLNNTWGKVVTHMSGGLLYGYEVPRPNWFSAVRKGPTPNRKPMPTPKADELENLIANTDLPFIEIARQLGRTHISIIRAATKLYRKRRVRGGRTALKQWWLNTHPPLIQSAA